MAVTASPAAARAWLTRRLALAAACLAAVYLVAAPGTARAQQAPPALTAPVNDFANVIDDNTERELDRRIRALQAASGDVVVVATVRTFQPYSAIEEYALEMFENGGRGIGAKGKDNGALILVAVDDRRARIETGYDLEEFITDGYAGETIRVVMTPRFRSGDYSGGLLQGATRIINRIAERRGVSLTGVPQEPRPQARPAGRFPWSTVIFIIVMLILMSRGGGGRGGRRRRRWGGGPWSGWSSGVGGFGAGTILGGGFGGFGGRGGGFGGGGFGGGGFGGFGGGRSGGGGASGGW